MSKTLRLLCVFAAAFALSAFSAADTFSGTLYYTNFQGGGDNVNSVNYSFNSNTNIATLSGQTGIAAVNGADGIIFAPNGNLLVGGQGNPNVHELQTNGTFVTDHYAGSANYHLTLDPNGQTVYTSDFEGRLDKVSLTGAPLVQQSPTGGDTGVTQLAFAPDGTAIYVNGNPNGFGNIGFYDLATGATTRLYTSVTPAHGVIYDPFTGKFTFFGEGYTGTMNTNGTGLATHGTGVCDFDQGAVDGQGHALVAGCNGITFISYAISGDINNPDYIQFFSGYNNIDDVAPLVGAGSQNPTPEPGTLILMGSGLLTAAGTFRKRLAR